MAQLGKHVSELHTLLARVEERVSALDRVMLATFVTYETMLGSQAKQVELALTASQTAIDKADAADEKARDRLASEMAQRFDSVNEFRNQQKDIISGFMPRAEFDQFRQYYSEQHSLLRDRYAQEIADLKGRLDRAEGRSGGYSGAWGYLVGAVGLVGALIALVFRNV